MPLAFDTLADLYDHGFDSVIDVRSPGEFAEDHLPGAINLPVLSDEERAHVGTVYKQVSPFKARKIGAALVFRNAAAHVSGPLAAHDGGWRPLVYCWRGGQRSSSFAWMLNEIGWRAETIEGGYRRYRRLVTQALYKAPLPCRVVTLGGHTGTAKTEVLPLLAQRQVQCLDLEGLARHRGSLLGELPLPQPQQKAFESALAHALSRLSPDRPLLVEAESSKIGALNLPPSLWEAMKSAPCLEVVAPLEARAAYLATTYADILADAGRLKARLAPLRYHRGHALVDRWFALIDAGDRIGLCRALATEHYDPAYDTARKARAAPIVRRFETPGLGAADLEALADRLAEALHTMSI